MKKRHAFRPTGFDALEDRTVLSHTAADIGLGNPAAFANPNPGQQIPSLLVRQAVTNDFHEFIRQYSALKAAFFATLSDQVPGAGQVPADVANNALFNFRNGVTLLVNNLTQEVLREIQAVPGGAGPLPAFVFARLAGTNIPGTLINGLTTITTDPGGGVDPLAYTLVANEAISSAMASVDDMIALYDLAGTEFINRFFAGEFRVIPVGNNAGVPGVGVGLPGVGTPGVPGQQAPFVDNVLLQYNQIYSNFLTLYSAAQARYFANLQGVEAGVGQQPGAADPFGIVEFRNYVSLLTRGLAQQVAQLLNTVPGGAGPLTAILTNRLTGNGFGSLERSLNSIPPVSLPGVNPAVGANFTREDFVSVANQAVIEGAIAGQNYIRLYDAALFDAQMRVFDPNLFDPRTGEFIGNRPRFGRRGRFFDNRPFGPRGRFFDDGRFFDGRRFGRRGRFFEPGQRFNDGQFNFFNPQPNPNANFNTIRAAAVAPAAGAAVDDTVEAAYHFGGIGVGGIVGSPGYFYGYGDAPAPTFGFGPSFGFGFPNYGFGFPYTGFGTGLGLGRGIGLGSRFGTGLGLGFGGLFF